MLEKVKERCYILSTKFNGEITSLIKSCLQDLLDVGIASSKVNFESKDIDDQILNCVVNYVKAYRGNDRADTEQYLKMYNSLKNKLSQQDNYIEEKTDE